MHCASRDLLVHGQKITSLVHRRACAYCVERRRRRDSPSASSNSGSSGSRPETLRYIAANALAHRRAAFPRFRPAPTPGLHERAVHHEQLLQRRGRDLAAGAVHRRFGKIEELKQIVQPPAADAGVDRAAAVAGLIEIRRGRRQARRRACRWLAGCSRDTPRHPAGAGSCARAAGWSDRLASPSARGWLAC